MKQITKKKIMNEVFDLTLEQSDIKDKLGKIEKYLNSEYWEYKQKARLLRDAHLKRTKSNRELYTGYKNKVNNIEINKLDLIRKNRGLF